MDKGATPAKTPKEAATDVEVLALMVVNAQQVEDVLFGAGEVAKSRLFFISVCFSDGCLNKIYSLDTWIIHHLLLNCSSNLFDADPRETRCAGYQDRGMFRRFHQKHTMEIKLV